MLTLVKQLTYVIVLCDDMERMKAFYRDLFAFEIDSESATSLAFRAGSVLLALRQRTRWACAPNYLACRSPFWFSPMKLNFVINNCWQKVWKSSTPPPTNLADTEPFTSLIPKVICSKFMLKSDRFKVGRKEIFHDRKTIDATRESCHSRRQASTQRTIAAHVPGWNAS